MRFPWYFFPYLLGAAAALLTDLFVRDITPGWLSVIVVGLAAITPGVVLSYLLLHRPLQSLANLVGMHSVQKDLHRCDFSTIESKHPLVKQIVLAMRRMQSTLFDFARSTAERGGDQAIASAKLSFSADMLGAKLTEQVAHARGIGETSQRIAKTTQGMVENAHQAESAAHATRNAGSEGQASVRETIQHIHNVRTETEQSANSLLALQTRSEEIQNITRIIEQVTEQTNLLALNAAIEAARAGEHGRGFAVVADEVRKLASKTTAATQEISEQLNTIYREIHESSDNMGQLVQVVDGVVEKTESIGSILENIHSLSGQSESEIALIAQAVQDHVSSVETISSALCEVENSLELTEKEVKEVAAGALYLADSAEEEYAKIAEFELNTVHDRVRHIAQDAAERIGKLFEDAVNSGRISLDDLMDRNYQPVSNTNPKKFSTRFDGFTDQVLPSVQEPILDANDFMLYAGAVDNNGYFPTHNKRYSKPLTGNYEQDLLNNRTKRIFSDRTGSRCGGNTAPFLLQTYKRDTGEIMHDMSAPIVVMGRHWGGFRIGYRSDHE